MKKILLIAVVLTFVSFYINAQISYEKRIELDLRNGYSSETIFESSEGFFILEATADEEVQGQKEIKYDLYNSDLILEKTETVLIAKGLRFSESYYNDEYVYNMYTSKQGEFIIISVRRNDLEIMKTKGTMPAKTLLKSMKVLGNQAYFLASVKSAPMIFRIDLSSGKGTGIPVKIGTAMPKNIIPQNYQILEKSKEIILFARVKVSKLVSELYMIRISENDNVEKPVKISGVGDNTIASISGCRVSDDNIVITGTYAKKGLKSEGLFFGEVDNGSVKYIRYYNFLELKDFLSYLPEKIQDKIEKKKARKESQGKEMKMNYWIADHDIMVLDDGYLFLGEAYYPTYRTETYYTTGANGTMVAHTRTVFDGYQYTHATLGKFSKDGDLMWDVCFALYPGYKPFYVKRFIAISQQTTTQISMVFTSGDKLVSKSITYDGEVVKDKSYDIIDTGNDKDKTKRTFSNVNYWYENYFLAYGSQVIKTGKEKRKVYFVNKIGF